MLVLLLWPGFWDFAYLIGGVDNGFAGCGFLPRSMSILMTKQAPSFLENF